jgi:quinol monooxygenase YgiN
MVPVEQPDMILLYEIYDNEACFTAHAESPRMAEHRAATRDMLLERRVTQCRVTGP